MTVGVKSTSVTHYPQITRSLGHTLGSLNGLHAYTNVPWILTVYCMDVQLQFLNKDYILILIFFNGFAHVQTLFV